MTDSDRSALKVVDKFEDLAEIAIGVLERMARDGHQIIQICGPYSTGGLGSRELNEARFKKAIAAAEMHGYIVFDQMPFEVTIKRISDSYGLEEGEYNHDILHIFYRLIFESGHIAKFLFIPGWESSKGATWEREEAIRLDIPMSDIPLEWLE